MDYMIKVNGRKAKAVNAILNLLFKNGELTTPEILDRINGSSYGVTFQELNNILGKWPCFVNNGHGTVKSIIGQNYDVISWRVDNNGLRKRYGVNSYEDRKRYQYIIDEKNNKMISVSKCKKLGNWKLAVLALQGNGWNIE